MSVRSAGILALMLVVRCFAAPVQQQTGAPAGIAVPLPSVANPSGSSADAPQSFSFRVRVVDGRNGTAVRDAHVKLWYDEPAGTGYEFSTDARGYGNMPQPVGEPTRVLLTIVGYVDCRKPLRGDPPVGYNLQMIAKGGTATENGCGQVSVRTGPGELVFFVRPTHWYEGLNRKVGN